jgi:hypothetical protein
VANPLRRRVASKLRSRVNGVEAVVNDLIDVGRLEGGPEARPDLGAVAGGCVWPAAAWVGGEGPFAPVARFA